MLFISITDFLIYINKYLFLFLFLWMSVFFILRTKLVYKHIITYSLLICILFLINYVVDGSFNNLLFMPIVGYLYFNILEKINCNKYYIVDSIIKNIVWISLFFALIEIFVKLNFIEMNLVKDFIINYGDQRIDVLRVRIFYGSSLSTAALTIFLSFYFIYFKKNALYLFLTFILILLSGSRTAFSIFVMLFSFSKIVNKNFFIYKLSISRNALITACLICLSSIVAIVYFWDTVIFKIINRTININLDESFYGRKDTSIETFINLLQELPISLLTGLKNDYISDSAFTSISATSGLLATFLVLFYIFYGLIKTRLSNKKKIFIMFMIVVGMSMIGDFLVPSVLFLYFLIIYTYKEQNEKN